MSNQMTETKTTVNSNLPVVTSQKVILSASDVKEQVCLIQQVMSAVMKDGEHYGTIPGCGDKPTLLKSGAEKLVSTFRLAPKYEEIAGSKEEDKFISYKIRCDLIHIPTGSFVGSGLGTCNSREKKYRERSIFENQASEEEKNIGRLVEKTSKGGKRYKYIVIPQDPWDLQNTLYKMACKRALVAAALNATAASDIFTQDIEDMEPVRSYEQRRVTETAPNAQDLIDRFMSAHNEISKQYGPDAYKQYLKNSKGESPTVEQIRGWKTPKQIAWLRTATEAMEERLAVIQEDDIFDGEVVNG